MAEIEREVAASFFFFFLNFIIYFVQLCKEDIQSCRSAGVLDHKSPNTKQIDSNPWSNKVKW